MQLTLLSRKFLKKFLSEGSPEIYKELAENYDEVFTKIRGPKSVVKIWNRYHQK